MKYRPLTEWAIMLGVDTIGLFVATAAILSLAAGEVTAPLPIVIVPLAGVLAYIQVRRDVPQRLIAWYTGTDTHDGGYKYA